MKVAMWILHSIRKNRPFIKFLIDLGTLASFFFPIQASLLHGFFFLPQNWKFKQGYITVRFNLCQQVFHQNLSAVQTSTKQLRLKRKQVASFPYKRKRNLWISFKAGPQKQAKRTRCNYWKQRLKNSVITMRRHCCQ